MGASPGEEPAPGEEPTTEELKRWKEIAYPLELAKAEETPPEEIEPELKKRSFGLEESVVSLEPLQLFQYKRRVYGKHRVHHGGVTCVSIEGDKVITLTPDTLVKPVAVAPEPEPPPEPEPEPEE